ncbi:hypothetical protein niasHT_000026 [Heterodera trifolii]|uniref:DNA polymerase epsilon catalytic subunit n=1 Tax=Heterodera trifolii TaxID=157864 RepID=A0ABD2M8N8_9BILA
MIDPLKFNGKFYKFDSEFAHTLPIAFAQVFHRLVKDIHHHSNVFADQLVVNMHRWISDPSSLLFHPSLRATLITLMRKLCLLLVAEMQKLGATVIHCSFTRIVFSTNRSVGRFGDQQHQ